MKRYQLIWAMVHKLRKAMGNRYARYTREGVVEMDEGYFIVELSEVEKSKGGGGRVAAGKQMLRSWQNQQSLKILRLRRSPVNADTLMPRYWVYTMPVK